jgi:MSHA biogenesis protein MshI
MRMGLFSKNKRTPGWLAIEFAADSARVAHITRTANGAPAVDLLAFFPDRQGASVPMLEKIAKETRAAAYQCSTLLRGGEYQFLSVDAPNVPPEELKTAIRWRLKDMLDFHIDDATIDVLDVPVDKNAPVRNHTMFAIAARNQLIEKRQGLFGEAKLPLSVIDIPEMAQRNISVLVQPEGRGVAMLSFDETGGLLTVTYGGELYLSRRIDVPVAHLVDGDEEQKRAIHDRITLELQRSLDHFDRQYHFITMAKLVLAPLPEGAQGVQEYLAANLYMPVERLDLETVLDISKAPELKALESQHRYFMVIGAALRLEEKAL